MSSTGVSTRFLNSSPDLEIKPEAENEFYKREAKDMVNVVQRLIGEGEFFCGNAGTWGARGVGVKVNGQRMCVKFNMGRWGVRGTQLAGDEFGTRFFRVRIWRSRKKWG